jgi:transcriptional regulator with XRE-family HTH domain
MSEGLSQKVREVAARLGKSERTIWYWASQGCDVTDEESIRQFSEGKQLKKSNVQKVREKLERAFETAEALNRSAKGGLQVPPDRFPPIDDKDLPPPGGRGAAAALARLEESEERARARLHAAMERGNPFEIEALQDFWLKCSETLRKLDLAVEMARRDAEEQIPKRLAEEISLHISEWLRISFAQFLSSEARSLMGIKDVGEWKAYAIERFKGILDLTVKSSLQTRSPIPDWAAEKVKEAWNVH